jgi:predicted nucleic-acid-binding Zn-ribbon protein
MNENIVEILIFLCGFVLPYFGFIGYLLWTNRCPKGGQHKYKETYGRYVKGYDMGFGITNSFQYKTCTCKKCGYSFKTYD